MKAFARPAPRRRAADARFETVHDLLLDGDKWAYAMIGGFGEGGDDFAVDSLAGLELFPKLNRVRGHVARGVACAVGESNAADDA